MSSFIHYLAAVRQAHAAGDSTEHTHRPALKQLLEDVGASITATNEPKRILCGSPDFQITRNGVPLGHVETKDIGTNLDEMERGKGPYGAQFIRYRDGLTNWLLTDYLEFRWFVGGEKRLTVRAAEMDVAGKLRPLPDGAERLAQLLDTFFKYPGLTIGTAKDLAGRLAGMTRIVRDLIVGSLEHETEQGWLHNWLVGFRETLIPDLNAAQFADMFAQTLAYGLFAAKAQAPVKTTFSREMAAHYLPKTNPFLRKLFEEFAGESMPDAIGWAVDDIVGLLRYADMDAILKDFGKGKGKEDPVVHFYETFLAAYDPKLREIRGVYDTPSPVVSYIVRSTDCLLRTHFGRVKGLADEDTLILDPATGTATFLYFVVSQIHESRRRQAGAWNSYVATHLLNRLFGFELLMAPYAVAHLKLGMLLKETGYQFESDQRLGIYLTNTLEEATKKAMNLFASWVSDEADAAAEIKKTKPIMVVLGNPPYSGHSANRSGFEEIIEAGQTYTVETKLGRVSRVAGGRGARLWRKTFIGNLIEDYKQIDGKPLGERNPKWLQDDYVKFLRWGSWRIDQTGQGILAFITNNSYLDNPTFRGMRHHLLKTFDEIYLLNLHGSSKKRETAPDGSKDENVFDIQQGVAIGIFIKRPKRAKEPGIFYADLWGSRETKYARLLETDVAHTKWKALKPTSPDYWFVPRHTGRKREYEKGWKITEAMPVNAIALNSHRDDFAVAFDSEILRKRVTDLRTERLSDEEVRSRYRLKESHDFSLAKVRAALRKDFVESRNIVRCLYRPFDNRFILFHDTVLDRPRPELNSHFLGKENLGLVTTRQTREPFAALAVNQVCGQHKITAVYDGSSVFPLYLYPNGELPESLFDHDNGRRPNLAAGFIADVEEHLKLTFVPDGRGDLRKDFGPEDVFHYMYAILHSPAYRERYAEFLKTDFPRVPLTSNLKLFRGLAGKGAELVALHLLESARLNALITSFPEKGGGEVERVQYTDKDQRVWINKTQYFGGVPKAVWEFHVGGYQVCEKWLQDRKGRQLAYEDIQHYQRIVIALNETIRLMSEIDDLIPAWPLE